MSYGNEEKLNQNLPIVKRNPLIEAKFKISPLEYKLLMSAASKINHSDIEFKDITFSVAEFCELMEIDTSKYKAIYHVINKNCKNLAERALAIKNEVMKEYFNVIKMGNDGYTFFPWLHHIAYDKAKINLRFHEYMKPFLLYIIGNKEYTKYIIENILNLQSIYSMRLYELLKQYEIIGERTIEIDGLREMLLMKDDEYSVYSGFKRRVILTAYKEINENTDISFEFEEIRYGTKVVAIKFFIKSKEGVSKEDTLDILPKDQVAKLLQLEIKNRYVVNFDVQTMIKYDKHVLVMLLRKIKEGVFDKAPIYSPKAFFNYKLEEISSMFDLRNKDSESNFEIIDNTKAIRYT